MMTKEAKWEQSLAETKLPVVLMFTSAEYCGVFCVIMENQLTRLYIDYPGKLQIYEGDITSNPSLVQLYRINVVPTVIVYKDGTNKETVRYELLPDWRKIYDLVRIRLFGSTSESALPPSGSGLGSTSQSAMPPGFGSTSASTSTFASASPIPSQVGK
ncbi:unnamed protein product [Microthlaspi erraticum]|uniref:Thioredoxin domain-containing protein n=1 Tax=Microthlaspi erraticum TaxID=1685480 RepID=A0A6D2HE32_9BRAS|nr:unnamed protein product [Microthlaspi erraticum]